LQRVLEDELQAGAGVGAAAPDLGDAERGRDRVRASLERAESFDALRQQAVGAREVAEHPLGDAEGMDAERFGGCEALGARERERSLEPRDGDIRLVLRHAELADELKRAPLRTFV